MSPIDCCLPYLQHCQPRHIVLASRQTYSQLDNCCTTQTIDLLHLTPDNPHRAMPAAQSFAVIIDFIEHLPKVEATQLLANWRNQYCPNIWLALDSGNRDWHFTDFIALGFKRLNALPNSDLGDGHLKFYGYELEHYNHQRRWNNPRYWANPERWTRR